MIKDDLLTTDEVAKILNINPQLLRLWRHRNEGPPSIKVGPGKKGVVRYSRNALCEYLTSNIR